MKYYYITTKHLENKVWFRDDEDYKVGMNKVALVSAQLAIRVMAFILMSNHVHFLIIAHSRQEAELFITSYKNQYSRHVRHKYGINELLRRNDVDIQEIENLNEAIERVIAYIQMNCVAANICSQPHQYAWGTGNTFFSQIKPKGIRMDKMPKARRSRILRSKLDIPGEYILGEDGYILPESYVDIETVERIFRTANRYNYFLQSSSKAKRKLETADSGIPAFRDQVVIPCVGELCRSLFQKASPKELKNEELIELLKQLRYRFSSNIQQLARVSGLTYEEVADKLDSI